jgi:hypothetical protein
MPIPVSSAARKRKRQASGWHPAASLRVTGVTAGCPSPRLPPVAITARRRGLGRQKAQDGFDGSFPTKLVPGRSSQGRPVTGQGGKQCKSDSLRSRP